MKMKCVAIIVMILFAAEAYSQSKPASLFESSFNHLDVSLSMGSMGVALEAGTDITDWLDVRAGISVMPEINLTMSFPVQVGDTPDVPDPTTGKTRFDKMAALLEGFTGFKVDDKVDMDCSGKFVNAKVMLDFKPFVNKDWHFTAGFFWGTRIIGRAVNTTEDMATTMAVCMYNTMYDKVWNYEPIISYDGLGVFLPLEFEDALLANGKMGMPVGTFKSDGTTYMMVPDTDGTVRAKAKVNSFKPYLGAGWEHTFGTKDEWRFGVDAGVVFWGGVPNVYTHDGTSLTKDVKDLNGKVGDVIDMVKHYPVFPLIEVKLTKRIF